MLPRRWVIERTLAWLFKNRRLVRDYEQLTAVAETIIASPRPPPSYADGHDQTAFSNALLDVWSQHLLVGSDVKRSGSFCHALQTAS